MSLISKKNSITLSNIILLMFLNCKQQTRCSSRTQ
jgi:hypothetical protein